MSFPALLATADRAVLQNVGGPVRYATGAGVEAEVRGVFDSAYLRQTAGTPGVMSAGPAVFLTLSDLPSDPGADPDAVVTVDGVRYTTREVQKDGMGGVILLLHLE